MNREEYKVIRDDPNYGVNILYYYFLEKGGDEATIDVFYTNLRTFCMSQGINMSTLLEYAKHEMDVRFEVNLLLDKDKKLIKLL